MARSEMTKHSFIVFSKNDVSSVLKIPVANFCRLIAPQTHPRLVMAGVWFLEISIAYGLWM